MDTSLFRMTGNNTEHEEIGHTGVLNNMNRGGRWIGVGTMFICASLVVTGCSSGRASHSNPSAVPNESNQVNRTVHTDSTGMPIAPYVYSKVNSSIVAMDSWNHVRSSFGQSAKMIAGNHDSFIPLTFVERSLMEAGLHTALHNQTLNVKVPSSIQVDATQDAEHKAATTHQLQITLNGNPVAVVPWLKNNKLKNSYIPIQQLLNALKPIHMKMSWNKVQTSASSKTTNSTSTWKIGSPIYGTVTTITSFATDHGSREMWAMTIRRQGDNWIPYDYIANSLDNTHAGIVVHTIGNFAGLNIKVPSSIPVNMKNIASENNLPKNTVPIKINNQIVGYASSMVPKFGTSGYLSSAEVMSAISRIDLNTHWNATNGTFSVWYITAPKKNKSR